jgi:hypothetical protein
VQWTALLKAPPVPTPPPAALVVHESQRLETYPISPQYQQPRFGNAPYAPMEQVHHVHNSAAIGSVVIGALAFCLSLIGLIPGSPIFYYSAGGILAIVGGIRALLRRRRGFGTVLWAPVLAIILGSLAALIMLSEIVMASVARGDELSGTSTSQALPQSQSQSGSAAATLPAPPTFSADAALTQYEATAAMMATSVYASYNGGQITTPNPQWPASVTESAQGTLLFPSGTSAGSIPSDEVIKYEVTSDGRGFDIAVSGGARDEVAIYDSELNTFTWTCDSSDAACPPGGISSDPDSSSATTT